MLRSIFMGLFFICGLVNGAQFHHLIVKYADAQTVMTLLPRINKDFRSASYSKIVSMQTDDRAGEFTVIAPFVRELAFSSKNDHWYICNRLGFDSYQKAYKELFTYILPINPQIESECVSEMAKYAMKYIDSHSLDVSFVWYDKTLEHRISCILSALIFYPNFSFISYLIKKGALRDASIICQDDQSVMFRFPFIKLPFHSSHPLVMAYFALNFGEVQKQKARNLLTFSLNPVTKLHTVVYTPEILPMMHHFLNTSCHLKGKKVYFAIFFSGVLSGYISRSAFCTIL